MNIFIDTISQPCVFILFDEKRNIIDRQDWQMQGNESSLMLPKIEELMQKNNLEFSQLENIVVVNGPGSFTGVRTSVLVANSVNFIIKKSMTPLSYFDLFNSYPIIKSSSRRDSFVQMNKDSKVEIIENVQLEEIITQQGINTLYGSSNHNWGEKLEIIEKIDYLSIISSIKLQELSKIEPLYIKKPNIC